MARKRLFEIRRDIIHTQARTCIGLIMCRYTAVYILPGWWNRPAPLFRFRLGQTPPEARR